MAEFQYPPINFQTEPSRYVHWQVSYNDSVATVIMDVQTDRPMWEGRYELKSGSYDLAVDIELNGRMNGQASAARIPTTLNVHNEEE